MTKEKAKAEILACKKKLGHVPNLTELIRTTAVTRHDVIGNFGSFTRALKECNLEKIGSGMTLNVKRLFLDWAKVVRRLKKIPLLYEYERHGRYSVRPFRKRFGPWPNVLPAMKLYALEHGLEDEWQDVMELMDAQDDGAPKGKSSPFDSMVLAGRPVYGRLIRPFPLVCAPTNEFGVIFLFGALAERLGFQVLRIQGRYPDGEALRLVGDDRLQRVKIEFEQQSLNFLRHGHDARKCDLIVCWEHNWPQAPVEVIELKTAVSNRQPAISQEQKLTAD